jgi:hypothetical protein
VTAQAAMALARKPLPLRPVARRAGGGGAAAAGASGGAGAGGSAGSRAGAVPPAGSVLRLARRLGLAAGVLMSPLY